MIEAIIRIMMPVLLGYALMSLAIVAGLAQSGTQHAGPALICDTKDQVVEFVELVNAGDARAAIAAVNANAKKENACGIGVLAYVESEDVGETVNNDGRWRIVKVIVIAVQTPRGWRPVPPLEQYTMMRSTDVDA
jgi:hypothetical protein